MAKNFRNNVWFLALASGFLLGLAYPVWPFDLGFLVWVGFVPLLWSLVKAKSGRTGFWLGFSAGFVFFLLALRWLASLHPLNVVGIESGPVSLIIVLLLYLISSAVMAVFWGLFGFAFVRFFSTRKLPSVWLAAGTAGLFVILEYGRAFGFGLFWLGPGSLLGAHWTIGNLAYALSTSPLALKFASYLGIYGLTLAIVFFNGLLVSVSQKTLGRVSRLALSALAVFLIISTAWGEKLDFWAGGESGPEINFAIIQTKTPSTDFLTPSKKLIHFKEQLESLNRLAQEKPETDIVVFPEASEFLTDLSVFLGGQQVQNYFDKLFAKPVLLISGSRFVDRTGGAGRATSRVFYLDSKNGLLGFYDKRLLTPAGEFLPYSIQLTTKLISSPTASEFERLRGLDAGGEQSAGFNFGRRFKAAAAVCSELLSPTLFARNSAESGIVAGLTSNSFFHGSRALVGQTKAVARLRAAENQKPILLAANLGLSYALDRRGSLIKTTANQENQILTGEIVSQSGRSWYNKLGDWPIFLVSFWAFGIIKKFRKSVVKT